ncbi:flh-2 [Pristionchus pacificus]|uniref:C2H2-type domain-containing protein n=1 Tax=Pristionchus pacificus TaxID=54126 RepID=A0A8R1YAS0_PRIPA|nr:flh-2 [Pristionchus pacificus]
MDSSSSSIIMDEVNSRESTPPPSSSVVIKEETDLQVSFNRVFKRRINTRSQSNVKETADESLTCPECGLLFTKPGNRNKHLRNVHDIEPELTPVEKKEKGCVDCGIIFPSISAYSAHRRDEHGTLFCPIPGCNWRGSSHKGLGKHATAEHSTNGKTFEWMKNEFENADEFEQFIREMYQKGHLWYIRNGSNSGSIDKIEYRYCFREDRRNRGKITNKILKNRKRKGKNEDEEEKKPNRILSGVEKSDSCCTSYMRVKWKAHGGVLAEYCIDHLGHESELTSLPLLPEHKEEIKVMMEIEDDPVEIVRRLRMKYEDIGGRLANIQEEDVREVMMEEVDPFGQKKMITNEEENTEDIGRTALISMEFSPSPSADETGDTSSALLALLDEHNVRDNSNISLGELVTSAQSQPQGKSSKKKAPRFKLTDNGFVFRFDKNSVCGERQFWRCERKSECAARIHTDMKGTIVKRINYHTHEANPNPDQVYLPKKRARLSPSNNSMDHNEGNGLPFSPTLRDELSGTNNGTFTATAMVNGGINGILDVFVKEEETGEMILNKDEARAGTSQNINGLVESDEFWKIFHLTKKVYAIVKKEVEKNENVTCDDDLVDVEVMSFLNDHRLRDYAPKLRRYSKTELLRLSVEECKEILEDVAEGVRMHHALRSECEENSNGINGNHNESGTSRPPIKVYVSNSDEMNPIYKMITLSEGTRNAQSFKSELVRRGIFCEDANLTICVNEGMLTVELCDEIMEDWKEDRVFRYRQNGEYFILEPTHGI